QTPVFIYYNVVFVVTVLHGIHAILAVHAIVSIQIRIHATVLLVDSLELSFRSIECIADSDIDIFMRGSVMLPLFDNHLPAGSMNFDSDTKHFSLVVIVMWTIQYHAATNNVVTETLQLLDTLVYIFNKRFRLVNIMKNNLKFIRHIKWSPCYPDE